VTAPHPLTTEADLDAAIERSFTTPVVMFKHSETCGASAYAHEELLALLAACNLGAEIYLVSVQRSRAISNAIEKRFRLRHESPQVLIVRRGVVAWHASHHRVTSDELSAALERTGAAPTTVPALADRDES
jgi:bacillithiol system protein YtxJ